MTTASTCRECGSAYCLECEAPATSIEDECPTSLADDERIACLQSRLATDQLIVETCNQDVAEIEEVCAMAFSAIETSLHSCD